MSGARHHAVIAGICNTRQARRLDGETSRSLMITAIAGALDDAGLTLAGVDGVSAGSDGTSLIYDLRIGPAWQGSAFGIMMFHQAVAAIEYGLASVVVLTAAQAGQYVDHAATAPWTRPATPAFATPYAPAIVTLAEGYQMVTNIINAVPSQLRLDLPVRVTFVGVTADLVLPYFEPA